MKRNEGSRPKGSGRREVSTGPGRQIIIGLLTAMLAGGVGWLWLEAMNKSQTPGARDSLPAPFPPPPIATSPYLNTGAEAQYVGSASCIECHADQHASYLLTAHSRSMSEVDPASEPADGAFDHAASGRRYRVYRDEGHLRHRESLPLRGGDDVSLCDFPLKYLVGSGRFSRTYLVEDGEFLVESPVTWYASLGRWAPSPGYDKPIHKSFHRTISYDCLFCHAGALEKIKGNDEHVRLLETAIGCERCHGPGSLHVEKRSAGGAALGQAEDLTIVNPRRLSRELAEGICHQCHLSSSVQVAVRGRSRSEFRPGLRWQDFVIDYGVEAGAGGMTVVGHVEQLRQSRCYQASGTLTCITCHDPHQTAPPAEPVVQRRTSCLKCHEDGSCHVAVSERIASNGNDCAACHMPASSTDIPHIAFTHHRIAVHRTKDKASAPPQDAKDVHALAPVLDISQLAEIDRVLSQGLAYYQDYRDHEDEPRAALSLEKARPLLQEVLDQGLSDPRLSMAMSTLAGKTGDLTNAGRWAQQAIASDGAAVPEKTAAQRILVEIALRENRVAEARGRLEELTAVRRDPRDSFLLGLCRQREGDLPGAATALERVLEIDPSQPETYDMLAPLYRALGQSEREQWAKEQASLIRKATAPQNARP